MAYIIHQIDQARGEIKVCIREWDGIDRPDYLNLNTLSPAQARAWAEQLCLAAGAADDYLEDKAKTTLSDKRALLKRLKSEVANLEAEVGDA